MNKHTPIYLLAILSLLLMLPGMSARAELIENRLPSGRILVAEFQAGNPQQPAVFLLHGFLQTHDSPTVKRLADSLVTAGYTTLSPTLSLGISRRAKSLPCEAAHRHTLQQDIAEIEAWMNWLAKRHTGPIVFIGHSYGSLQGLVYSAGKPHPALRRTIALSLIDTEQKPTDTSREAMLAKAKAGAAKGDKGLMNFALGHCKQFTATPQSYLSYANWNRKQVLELARTSRVTVNVVMGGKDSRMGTGWAQALAGTGAQVNNIEGANHFFDAEYEFDLLDLILNILKKQKTEG